MHQFLIMISSFVLLLLIGCLPAIYSYASSMLLPNNDFNAPENNGCLVPLAPNPGYCGARNIRIRSDFVISVRRLRTDE